MHKKNINQANNFILWVQLNSSCVNSTTPHVELSRHAHKDTIAKARASALHTKVQFYALLGKLSGSGAQRRMGPWCDCLLWWDTSGYCIKMSYTVTATKNLKNKVCLINYHWLLFAVITLMLKKYFKASTEASALHLLPVSATQWNSCTHLAAELQSLWVQTPL